MCPTGLGDNYIRLDALRGSMIDEHKYGSFTIDKKLYQGSVKLVEGAVRYWDPQEYEITSEDLRALLLGKPEFVVIGLGPGGLFKVGEDVMRSLSMRKIRSYVGKNVEMIKRYNELLRDKKKVNAIFPCRG